MTGTAKMNSGKFLFSGPLLIWATALTIATAASRASAGDLTIEGGNLVSYDTVDITTPAYSGSFYAAPLSFQVESPPGAEVQTVYGFCVDVFHEIAVPINSALSYNAAPLTTDFNGATLTSTQVGEIGALARAGVGLIGNPNTVDLADRLAAFQIAIWQTEEPGSSYSFTSSSAAVTSLVSRDEAWAATHQVAPSSVVVMSPASGTTQCCGAPQAFTVGSVPEPATWSMMIVGVGLMGVALRRRRGATVSTVTSAL